MRRRELIHMAMALQAGGSPAPPNDNEVWSGFLEWLRTAGTAPDVGSLLDEHRKSYAASGVPEQEAARRMVVIRRLMGERHEAWPRLFDLIYASVNPGFRTLPNSWLIGAVEGRKPGRALDIAMGQGRNSVFLAMRGWDAGGFDVSPKGLEAARAAASRAGVSIRTELANHEKFPMGQDHWDLIAAIYAPVPLADPAYARRLHQALRPGGILVAESFARPESPAAQTPVDLESDSLLEAHRPLRLLHFEDCVAQPDWGPKPTRLIRIVAEKR